MQAVAVLIGAVGAAYLSLTGGSMPAITLTLAVTFALYGLTEEAARRHLARTARADHGDGHPRPSGGRPARLGHLDEPVDVCRPWRTAPALLSLAGVATAIPLLFFAAAARRIPLVTIGLLQFLTPGLQLASGVLFLGEHMTPTRWVGFGIVWIALLVLTVDSLRASGAAGRHPIEPEHTEATP